VWTQLSYRTAQLGQHALQAWGSLADGITRILLYRGRSFLAHHLAAHPQETAAKQARLDHIAQTLAGGGKVAFVVFRDLHWVDWFLPITSRLEAEFPDRVSVLYISYSSVLKRVGRGRNLMAYRQAIEARMKAAGVDPHSHFSHEEIPWYNNFPQPGAILTTEGIPQENFSSPHRVYVPHYFVLKARDVLPANIRYNHLFCPAKPPFTYRELDNPPPGLTVHRVGYPKMDAPPAEPVRLFANPNPVVIYAPSLEVDILLDTLGQGLLELFQRMAHLNFVVKLHPSLGSRRHPITRYFASRIHNGPNIVLDTTTSIQQLAPASSLLIADYGSVGAEYRVSFGKRVIYLPVPSRLEGGSDLLFRDRFADAVTPVAGLEDAIGRLLAQGDLPPEQREEMGQALLYGYGHADLLAAHAVLKILEGKFD